MYYVDVLKSLMFGKRGRLPDGSNAGRARVVTALSQAAARF